MGGATVGAGGGNFPHLAKVGDRGGKIYSRHIIHMLQKVYFTRLLNHYVIVTSRPKEGSSVCGEVSRYCIDSSLNLKHNQNNSTTISVLSISSPGEVSY